MANQLKFKLLNDRFCKRIRIISIAFLLTSSSLLTNQIAYSAADTTKINSSIAIKADTTKRMDTANTISISKDFPRVSQSKFMYADTRRFTIDGSLPFEDTHIKPLTAGIIGGIYTGIFIVQHEMQQNTIWKKTGPFNVAEDAQYTMYLDKAGHFFGTYLPSYIFSEALMTSGLSYDAATVWGASLGLAYTGYVEILDGYSVGFGFSPSDFYADLAGAGFFVAQHYIPYLQNFSPKFMYVKPSWHGEINRVEAESFIDDYSSQAFFMSINVYNMLPEKWKKYWVPWLELSVGYAVYSLCTPNELCTNCNPKVSEPVSRSAWGNRKIIISLDYNLAKILPDGPPWWNWLRQSLNMFKLPSPSIEIGTHKTQFRLLYPFQFELGNVKF